MPTENIPNPATTSSDYDDMIAYWSMVSTILGGVPSMKENAQLYLPMFPEESQTLYNLRAESIVMTNIYRDVVENLASKPFSKKVRFVEDKASDELQTLAEDIDGRGNNLHVFLAETFFNGINKAIDWIFVDKAPLREGVTVAEEKRLGARPYWVHLPAEKLLAVYSDIVNGKEEIVHARIHEPEIQRQGWGELYINRVRILNREPVINVEGKTIGYGPATWEVWEEKTEVKGQGTSTQTVWKQISSGLIAIKVIALVPFITGRRIGKGWIFEPPMKDAAFAQLDHYQQENGKKDARVMTAYPMLVGSGVTQIKDDHGNPIRVPVGPRTTLFAPMTSEGRAGDWKWIEPAAQSLTWLSTELKAKEDQIRELGRQPLTAQSGNLTVIMAGVAAAKGNTAVQAWTFGLKDTAEQAFIYTTMYMNSTEQPEVWIHTDFPVEGTAEKAPDMVIKLRENGEISRVAMFEELKRFNIISPDYDPEADAEKIAEEEPDDPTAEDLQAALGNQEVVPPIRVVK